MLRLFSIPVAGAVQMSSLFAVVLCAVPADAAEAKWTVHEWGTFTSVQDERGRELAGINIDDEPVPKFVHNLSPYLLNSPFLSNNYWQNRQKAAPRRHPLVTMRLETPVIYFYPPDNATLPQTIDVDVEFRGGWLTEFYPKAKADAPGLGRGTFQFGNLTPETISSLSWKGLRVGTKDDGPKTDAHVWTAPRKVASQQVTTPAGESERYLFYRGVGNLRAPLRVTTDRKQNSLNVFANFDQLSSRSPTAIRSAWLAHILPNQEVAFRQVSLSAATADPATLLGTTHSDFVSAEYDKQNLKRLKQEMKTALVSDGLYEDEATAMLDTWQRAYFTSPGLRLFFLVPRVWTDHYLPLKLSRDAQVARVMMGRIELVTEDQRELLKKLAKGPVSDTSWINKLPKSAARTMFLAGRADFGDLGVEIPKDFQTYLDLGRFRNALVVDHAHRHPTKMLTAFINNYGLKPYMWRPAPKKPSATTPVSASKTLDQNSRDR